MSDRFAHILAMMTSTAWALREDALEAVCAVIARRMDGERLSREKLDEIKGPRSPNGILLPYSMDASGQFVAAAGYGRSQSQQGKSIGVINVYGIIAQHASAIDDMSGPGGTSTDRLMGAIDQAMSDPSIGALVLNFDSPGGTVHGLQETHDKIMSYRGSKPIISQVNSTAASAAYWLASAAEKIHVTPSGEVGSIGVYTVHKDVSKATEEDGVKFTLISAGKYKVEANAFEPLGDDARAYIQSGVDRHMSAFVNCVAKGRGVNGETVATKFGEGRMMGAHDSVRIGMADKVATLDQTLRSLATTIQKGGGANAYAGDYESVVAAVARASQASLTAELVQEGMKMQTANFNERFLSLEANFSDRFLSLETALQNIHASLRAGRARSVAEAEPAKPGASTETIASPDATPSADTSPLMKNCEQCGCNYDATGEPGFMEGNEGPGSADGTPSKEHHQSSKMQKCPECGVMREPPANRDGQATDGAAASAQEQDRLFRQRWRARRYASGSGGR